jgi:DNA-binding IclR family transcriptional regulator
VGRLVNPAIGARGPRSRPARPADFSAWNLAVISYRVTPVDTRSWKRQPATVQHLGGAAWVKGMHVTATMRGNDRLLAILDALGEQPYMSLSDVADRVGLPRPTALRFLRSLEPSAWVLRKPDGRYSLGPAVLALAGRYLSSDTLLVAASPHMRALRDDLGETVTLSRVSGGERTCVQVFPSTQSLRLVLNVGEKGPLHAGGVGLVLLAHLPADRRAAILDSPLRPYTDRTVLSRDALEEQCAEIRERGWVVTHGQKTVGGVTVALALHEAGTDEVSALGIFGPEARCHTPAEERRWLSKLRECAAAITASMSS